MALSPEVNFNISQQQLRSSASNNRILYSTRREFSLAATIRSRQLSPNENLSISPIDNSPIIKPIISESPALPDNVSNMSQILRNKIAVLAGIEYAKAGGIEPGNYDSPDILRNRISYCANIENSAYASEAPKSDPSVVYIIETFSAQRPRPIEIKRPLVMSLYRNPWIRNIAASALIAVGMLSAAACTVPATNFDVSPGFTALSTTLPNGDTLRAPWVTPKIAKPNPNVHDFSKPSGHHNPDQSTIKIFENYDTSFNPGDISSVKGMGEYYFGTTINELGMNWDYFNTTNIEILSKALAGDETKIARFVADVKKLNDARLFPVITDPNTGQVLPDKVWGKLPDGNAVKLILPFNPDDQQSVDSYFQSTPKTQAPARSNPIGPNLQRNIISRV